MTLPPNPQQGPLACQTTIAKLLSTLTCMCHTVFHASLATRVVAALVASAPPPLLLCSSLLAC